MISAQHPLTDYLGKPTKTARLEITGTGSGLDRSMVMPPVALEPGAEVDVVLRCVVEKHRHEYDEDQDAFGLVNLLRAQTAALVDDPDAESVGTVIKDAEKRVAERRAEVEATKRSADGEDPLPFDDGERAGLGKPDLDAAEKAIRDRAADSEQVDDVVEVLEDLEQLDDDEIAAIAIELTAPRREALEVVGAGGQVHVSNRTDRDKPSIYWQSANWLQDRKLIQLVAQSGGPVQLTPEGRQILAHLEAQETHRRQAQDEVPF